MAPVMKFLCVLNSAFFLSSFLVVAQTAVTPAPTGVDPTAELMYTLHKIPDSGETSTAGLKEAGMSAEIEESTRKLAIEGSTVESSGNGLSFSKDVSTPPMIATEHHTSHITTSITEESKKEPGTTPMSDKRDSTEAGTEKTIPKKETVPPVAGSTPKPVAKETTESSIGSHGGPQAGPNRPVVDKITTSTVSTTTTTTKLPMTKAPNSGESSIPTTPDDKSLATSTRTSILIVIISVFLIAI